MAGRRDYDIAFVGLKPGEHEYHYEIDDAFFEGRPPQEFDNCKAKVRLVLDRHPSFLMLKFEVGGTVGLVCGRCGSPLTRELWDDFEMVVKMVDDPEAMNAGDEDPDIHYISRTESHINVADWLYEFVNLSIPMHPMCEDVQGGRCDPEVIEMLDRMRESNERPEEGNPLWKGLDRFRNE